jgi:hypothetical protein
VDPRANAFLELFVMFMGKPGLRDDHDTIPMQSGMLHAEGDDASPADALHLFDLPLDILRMIFPAVDNHHVLAPAADIKVAIRQVAEIPGVQPFVA